MAKRTAKRRASRDPEVKAGSPFAPVIAAGETWVKMLMHPRNVPKDEHMREIIEARCEGIQSMLSICRRASAGQLIDVAYPNPSNLMASLDADATSFYPQEVASTEERLKRLEAAIFGGQASGDGKRSVQIRVTPVAREMPKILQPIVDAAAKTKSQPHGVDLAMTEAERRVLIACAMHPDGVERLRVSFLTGYSKDYRNRTISALTPHYVAEIGKTGLRITTEGVNAAGTYAPLSTGATLISEWMGRLDEAEANCFRIIVDAYPSSVERETISEETKYSKDYRNRCIARLVNTHGLVVATSKTEVIASRYLFD